MSQKDRGDVRREDRLAPVREALRALLIGLSEDDRADVLGSVFCVHCGTEKNGICHCTNDE